MTDVEDPTGNTKQTVMLDDRGEDSAGPLHVAWRREGEEHTNTFTESFTIGRDTACDVAFIDEGISRTHARVYPQGGFWHIEDLGSSNGSFLDNVRISQAVIPRTATLRLGVEARFELTAPLAPVSITEEQIAERYFSGRDDDQAGGRTKLVRGVYRRVEKRQKRRYRGVIAVVAVALIASLAIAAYQYEQLQKTRALATELFYGMKAVQVEVARIEDLVGESSDARLLSRVEQRRSEVRELEAQYDAFLEELDVLGPDLSEEDRLILRVARIFGECELTMPPGFADEVKEYIRKWQTTNRLRNSIKRMQDQALTKVIADAMLEHHLPPQFLYVALQESDFNSTAVGPKTRFGIAKGMWQFIPSTARRYGLRTGPLVEMPVHDPMDDRFKPELATPAAARYLKDIYSKEAQASGLLVMASYNWGPNNIRKRIREMPDNPRDRNFWELLKLHNVPNETYNYVYYIVSAIVIGENPALFGFDFDNPLEGLEVSAAAPVQSAD